MAKKKTKKTGETVKNKVEALQDEVEKVFDNSIVIGITDTDDEDVAASAVMMNGNRNKLALSIAKQMDNDAHFRDLMLSTTGAWMAYSMEMGRFTSQILKILLVVSTAGGNKSPLGSLKEFLDENCDSTDCPVHGERNRKNKKRGLFRR